MAAFSHLRSVGFLFGALSAPGRLFQIRTAFCEKVIVGGAALPELR